jgi:hypothetical protein
METDITSFVAFVAALILLAVTSVRFGVDSRDGLATDGNNRARRGIL